MAREMRGRIGFSSPQITSSSAGNWRSEVQFRTPQHPLGGNGWGADSPLLSDNIPTESLYSNYLYLDYMSSDFDDDDTYGTPSIQLPVLAAPSPAAVFGRRRGTGSGLRRRRWRGLLSKLKTWWRRDDVVLGHGEKKKKKKRKSVHHFDIKTRWPQGWY